MFEFCFSWILIFSLVFRLGHFELVNQRAIIINESHCGNAKFWITGNNCIDCANTSTEAVRRWCHVWNNRCRWIRRSCLRWLWRWNRTAQIDNHFNCGMREKSELRSLSLNSIQLKLNFNFSNSPNGSHRLRQQRSKHRPRKKRQHHRQHRRLRQRPPSTCTSNRRSSTIHRQFEHGCPNWRSPLAKYSIISCHLTHLSTSKTATIWNWSCWTNPRSHWMQNRGFNSIQTQEKSMDCKLLSLRFSLSELSFN